MSIALLGIGASTSVVVMMLGHGPIVGDDLESASRRGADATAPSGRATPTPARPGRTDRGISRMGAGDDCGAADVDRYGVALTPSIYLLNFSFLYLADPELAAMMPAYKAPIPAEVLACLEDPPSEGCPWADYSQYFDNPLPSACATQWPSYCQIDQEANGLLPSSFVTADQVNQPLGQQRANEMAAALGFFNKGVESFILTPEEYACLIGPTPPSQEQTEEQLTTTTCIANLTNSIGNVPGNIPLSSYGLNVTSEGLIQSNCETGAPCLLFNDLIYSPGEGSWLLQISKTCGFTEKIERLVTNTPFLYFAALGPECQSSECSSSYVCTIQGICSCPGDLNADGVVDGADIGILSGAWNTDGEDTPGSDINGDQQINGADLGLLIGAWGSCP